MPPGEQDRGHQPATTSPRNRNEADAQLNNLLRERGLHSNDGIADGFKHGIIHRSLEILSQQLYSTETRFIHEIMQNADDNAYGKSTARGSLPSFLLSLKSDGTGNGSTVGISTGSKKYTLETSCNEDGFSFAQIAALTDIGASTKTKCKDVHGGFTGEKGVGFKAVFRVASAVYVASGHYHFKLDNSQGMIGALRPLPCSFPASESTSGSTRMMVELKGQEEFESIKRDLGKVRPEILLFLRRLRRVSVDTATCKKEYTATHHDDDKEYQGETRAVVVHDSARNTSRVTKYIVVRKRVDDMPKEPRRENIMTSEVTLAFPLTSKGNLIVQQQQVFAFLPINYYGFRFLIQGDFILTASRESLAPAAWNEKLQEAIPSAFEAAIHRFNSIEGGLRYLWPQYLELSATGIAFGENLGPKLVKYLGSCQILQGCDDLNSFQKPRNLVFVPPKFCLYGKPLIECRRQQERYLAFEYAPNGTLPSSLNSLGVRTMDDQLFVSHFCNWMVQEKPKDLGLKTSEWHNRVAVILGQAAPTTNRANNAWAFMPASTTNLYLASIDVAWSAPCGLALFFVNPEDRNNADREALFKWLGLSEFKTIDICHRILHTHEHLDVRYSDPRPREHIIQETIYLYVHRKLMDRTTNNRLLKLWVVTEDCWKPSPARYTYLIDPDISPNLVLQYASELNPFMRILHPDYFEYANARDILKEDAVFEEGTKTRIAATVDDAQVESHLTSVENSVKRKANPFAKWLKDSCKIATLPRLTHDSEPTQEALWLIDNAFLDLLLLLRDNTLQYPSNTMWILSKGMKAGMVKCCDGVMRSLDQIAIPTPKLLEACPHLSFADLPDPGNMKWQYLSQFKVVTEANDAAYLQELEVLCQLPITSGTLENARRVYQYLGQNGGNFLRGSR
ncbi:heterokaryon incompatibility protein [Colletotrichum tofieldiae]|nr:heterokaryon incompatibility protein [Colletotrichum tofieldiae]